LLRKASVKQQREPAREVHAACLRQVQDFDFNAVHLRTKRFFAVFFFKNPSHIAMMITHQSQLAYHDVELQISVRWEFWDNYRPNIYPQCGTLSMLLIVSIHLTVYFIGVVCST